MDGPQIRPRPEPAEGQSGEPAQQVACVTRSNPAGIQAGKPSRRCAPDFHETAAARIVRAHPGDPCMSQHPLNPVPSPETPRPDPAYPLSNPPPLPGHAPQELPAGQPTEIPTPDPDRAPTTPGTTPSHPLGPYDPQPKFRPD